MTRSAIILCLSFVFAQIAQAIPCGSLLNDLDVRNYNFVHAPPSARKPLLLAAFQRSELPSAMQAMLGEGATINNAFSVRDVQFRSDATPSQIGALQQFSYAAVVSLPNAPDQCFLVWFSPTRMDMNAIIGQDASGSLRLGSNNKVDLNVYMTLIPPGARR